MVIFLLEVILLLGRWMYQKYCDALKELSLGIMQLLAISLGVDISYYRNLFEDGYSIMRCNSYPPCKEAGLVMGTGPHCDPVALTILHQDQVKGLEVFVDNKWQSVKPRPGAFVINIGDTFMVGLLLNCLPSAYFLYLNSLLIMQLIMFFKNHIDSLTTTYGTSGPWYQGSDVEEDEILKWVPTSGLAGLQLYILKWVTTTL